MGKMHGIKHRRTLLPVALLATGALLLGAFSTTAASATTTTKASTTGPNTPKPKPLPTMTPVVIGYTAPIEVFAEPELALLNGEFAKENLNATVQLVTPSTVPQLLAQGTIQVALNGVSAGTLNAIDQGVDVTAIGNVETLQASDPSGLYIQKQFLNAKGKLKKPLPSNFTLTLGNTGLAAVSIYWTEKYLEANGLTINDTTNVNLAQNLIGTALTNGSVDAGFANNPYAGPLATNPNLVKVAPAGGAAWYVSTTGYITQHANVVQAVMRALVRTARTYLAPGYRNNPKVMSQISTWLNVPTATINLSPAAVFLPNMDLAVLKPIVQGVQQTWIKVGNVLTYPTPIPFSKLTDPAILASVLGKKK